MQARNGAAENILNYLSMLSSYLCEYLTNLEAVQCLILFCPTGKGRIPMSIL